MATSAYSTRSLLPWQASKLPLSPGISESYSLYLLTHRGAVGHLLIFHQVAEDGRWHWVIFTGNTLDTCARSRPEGYTRPHLGERALLFALARLLHSKNDLPASLPPQGTTIAPAIARG